ncbi:restriction endonuclease [Vagococcus sp. BWB3-3]|uniref:Restriction endonuclease n=1 Tax=Vagococcus allomyrinae TaxID=2794353 RepID=A0A940P954_9ENTE|nr:restriction endonuclease [Vagococcus allomyrinae]
MGNLMRNSRIGLSIFFIVVGVFGAFSNDESSVLIIVLTMLTCFGIAYAFLPKDLKETLKSRVIKGYRPVAPREMPPIEVREVPVKVVEAVGSLSNQDRSPELAQWDQLCDLEFKTQLVDFLIESGYEQVELKKNDAIFGIKNGEQYLFGCQSSNQTVAVSVVHDVIAKSRDFESIKLVAVTNDYFSDEAIDFAKETDVTLWNRDTLTKLIMFYRK